MWRCSLSRSRSRNVRWEATEEQLDPALKVRRLLAQSAPLAWTEAGRSWKTPEDVAAWEQAVRNREPWLLEAAATVTGGRVDSYERMIADLNGVERPKAFDLEAARAVRKESVMPTAAEKNKKPSLTDLPEPELRAKLLATPTLPDQAWAPKLGKPERAEGESRTAYIERVLAG